MRYSSRKFLIALLLIFTVLYITWLTVHIIPPALLVSVMPALLGFDGIVLGAVAVMYPVANVFQTSKWGGNDSQG